MRCVGDLLKPCILKSKFSWFELRKLFIYLDETEEAVKPVPRESVESTSRMNELISANSGICV